jgi:hypothetical protein
MDRIPCVSDVALEIAGIAKRVSPVHALRELDRCFDRLAIWEITWVASVVIENMRSPSFDDAIILAISELDHLARPGAKDKEVMRNRLKTALQVLPDRV